MRRALITGITGQDGSYLAESLLKKGYEVYGIIRRASTFNTGRIDNIYQDPHNPRAKMFLYYGDFTDSSSISEIVNTAEPDEIYHLQHNRMYGPVLTSLNILEMSLAWEPCVFLKQ